MTTHHTRLIGIMLLVLGLFGAPRALALEIESVDPSSAPQGTIGLPVHVFGSGFDRNTQVRFLLNGSPTTDIAVRSKSVESSGEIVVTIDISADALADTDYTLQLYQRRGGKGTTTAKEATFRVSRNTKETVVCGGANGVFTNIDASECNCLFVKKQEDGQGTPGVSLWVLQDDCETSAMLEMPVYSGLNGNGNILRAVHDLNNTGVSGPFDGYSVLANAGHRAHVFSLNIVVDANVTNTGCDEDTDLVSGIGFVLDGDSEHPGVSTDSYGRVYPLSRLRAWGNSVTVDSLGSQPPAPLCRSIEFRRDDSYNDMLGDFVADYGDGVVAIGDVLITSGSYSDAGIQVSGFINSGSGGRTDEKIGILDNTVMSGAGSAGSAIRFGPVYGGGTVGQNAISANGGVGISVEGGDDMTIENNNIEGADTAIRADGDVEYAYFKSNVLVGDPLNSADVGIDTYAGRNRYRSNRFSDFACDIKQNGDCNP